MPADWECWGSFLTPTYGLKGQGNDYRTRVNEVLRNAMLNDIRQASLSCREGIVRVRSSPYTKLVKIMRVISNKALKLFAQAHPHADKPLQDWRKNIEKSRFDSYAELKRSFNSVDKAGEFYVFDVAGNHYRLVAAIHFNTQTVYVRDILTHTQYNHWRP